MGSVFRQTGRRNWMIRYYRDGRRIDESARTPDRTEAKKLLRQREADIDRGLPLGPTVGRIRFEEAATDITNEYQTNRRRPLRGRRAGRTSPALLRDAGHQQGARGDTRRAPRRGSAARVGG